MTVDVLVVGAGIAGLALATALREVGIEIDVVERAPALRADGAGILLHPNARRALAGIGVDLVGRGSEINCQTSFDPQGAATVVDWRQVWDGAGLPLGIHRGVLAAELLAGLDPIRVRWAVRPVDLFERADCVDVAFSDGSAGRYRLVIGADGIGSWVRRYVDPAAEPVYLGQMYWRTTVPVAPPLDFPDWRVWRARGHFFGGMPLGEGTSHLFLQAACPDPVPASAGPRRLAEVLAEMGGPVPDMGAALRGAGVHLAPATGVSVSRWVRGRIALVGDAAHALSPSASQGGALSIEDAVVVAEEVRRVGATPEALAAFEQRRRPRLRRFAQRTRLHLMLIEAAQRNGGFADRIEQSPEPDDSVQWFRKLYEPLMTTP